MILSLDLGTQTGWAIGDLDKKLHIASGTISFKPTKFDSKGHRFVKFWDFLDELHKKYQFNFCIYEAVRRHIGTDASHMYGGYMYHLQHWCIKKNMEYTGIAVGAIKKHITGKGNSNKEKVIEAVKSKLNIIPTDDNQADAIALCDCYFYH